MVTTTINTLKQDIKTRIEKIRSLKKDRKSTDPEKRCTAQYKLHKARIKIRCMHIAYSLMRGRTYEQIERPAPNNPPDWNLIERIKSEYSE